MLRFLGRARAFSLATLFVFASSVPASIAALMHEADDLCQPAFVVHDENAHRFGAARSDAPASQHCAVCHWLQSFHSVTTADARVEPATDFHHLAPSRLFVQRRSSLADLPARAPPRA